MKTKDKIICENCGHSELHHRIGVAGSGIRRNGRNMPDPRDFSVCDVKYCPCKKFKPLSVPQKHVQNTQSQGKKVATLESQYTPPPDTNNKIVPLIEKRKWACDQKTGKPIVPFFDYKDIAEALKNVEEETDDLVHYERVCKKCGMQWGSLHCQHDGVQGTCPKCNTRGSVNLDGECDCEFTCKVSEIKEILKKHLGEFSKETK